MKVSLRREPLAGSRWSPRYGGDPEQAEVHVMGPLDLVLVPAAMLVRRWLRKRPERKAAGR